MSPLPALLCASNSIRDSTRPISCPHINAGVRILLGTHITPNDLQTAHNLLDVYVKLYEEYYGMSVNFLYLYAPTHYLIY